MIAVLVAFAVLGAAYYYYRKHSNPAPPAPPDEPTLIGVANGQIYYYSESSGWLPTESKDADIVLALTYGDDALYAVRQKTSTSPTELNKWVDSETGFGPALNDTKQGQIMLSLALNGSTIYGLDANPAQERGIWKLNDKLWKLDTDLLGKNITEIEFIDGKLYGIEQDTKTLVSWSSADSAWTKVAALNGVNTITGNNGVVIGARTDAIVQLSGSAWSVVQKLPKSFKVTDIAAIPTSLLQELLS